jgi:hypothetical protein
LAKLRCESAAPDVARIAAKSSLYDWNVEEQFAAIEALAEIGGEDQLSRLERMAVHRPLLNRSRHDALLPAVQRAVERIHTRVDGAKSEAA